MKLTLLDLISLNLPSKILLLYNIRYLTSVAAIDKVTIWWTNRFYGKNLKELKSVLENMTNEDIS